MKQGEIFVSRKCKQQSYSMQEATIKNLLGQLCLKHGRLWSLMQHQDTVLSILVACEFYLSHQEWQLQVLSGMDSKLCIQSFHLLLHPKNQPSEGKKNFVSLTFHIFKGKRCSLKSKGMLSKIQGDQILLLLQLFFPHTQILH